MSIFYICPTCGNICDLDDILLYMKKYNEKAIPRKIKCGDCEVDMFECDEEMIIPIQILNQKGYKTRYCCSGHVTERACNSYIMFDWDMGFDSLPRGWHYDKKKYPHQGTVIRSNITKNVTDPIKRRSLIHRRMSCLIRWAMDLKDLKEVQNDKEESGV